MSSVKEYFSSMGSGFASLIKGLSVTGKEFLTPKITEKYPDNRETHQWPERFRACLELIYDKDGNRLSTVQDEDAVALYGLLEKHITQQDGQDAQQEAKQILRDQGLSQTISVSCMGDLRLTTGKTVVVRQPVTGLSGVLWIESDQHVWNGGNYTTNLTLNLRNLMYESETGSELK